MVSMSKSLNVHLEEKRFPSQNVSLQHSGAGDGGGGQSVTSLGSFSGHHISIFSISFLVRYCI